MLCYIFAALVDLRNSLFMLCICMIALNVLLSALGFWTQCLLKTKTSCWSAFALCSAQYSGILFWHNVNRSWSGETVPSMDFSSRSCIVRKVQVPVRHHMYYLAAITDVSEEPAAPCKICNVPQAIDDRCLMWNGRVAWSLTLCTRAHKTAENLLVLLALYTGFLHSKIWTAFTGELHRLNSVRRESCKKSTCVCFIFECTVSLCYYIK